MVVNIVKCFQMVWLFKWLQVDLGCPACFKLYQVVHIFSAVEGDEVRFGSFLVVVTCVTKI